jgi:hypothetical protein
MSNKKTKIKYTTEERDSFTHELIRIISEYKTECSASNARYLLNKFNNNFKVIYTNGVK